MLEKNYSSVTRFTPHDNRIAGRVSARPAFSVPDGTRPVFIPGAGGAYPGREIVFCSFFTPAEEEPYVAANNPHGPDF